MRVIVFQEFGSTDKTDDGQDVKMTDAQRTLG